MRDLYAQYQGASGAEREFMLLNMIHEHQYYPNLAPMIAKEDLGLIVKVAQALLKEYPYLFTPLLCAVTSERGIELAISLLRQIDFVHQIQPTDLTQVGVCISSDGNPLGLFYQEFGPEGLFALSDADVVDIRQLYLWARSQSRAPAEQFLLDLASHFQHNFIVAPAVLSHCLTVEYDIAAAQSKEFHLRGYVNLLGRIQNCFDREEVFRDFLSYLSQNLRSRRPVRPDLIEDIIFIKFLQHAVDAHFCLRDSAAFQFAYWRWLIDASPDAFSDIRKLLS